MIRPRSLMRSLGTVALAAVTITWLAGCDDESDENPASERFRSPTGPVPATPQRPGDAATGYRALVNAPYVSCGLPYRVYERLSPPADPDDLLPGRQGRNAELPYPLTAHVNADGVEIVSSNCLLCHASHFEGELVVGLGNEFLDFTRDPQSSVNEAGLYVRGEGETAAWRRWADRIEGIAPYSQTSTLGANPATNLTWALIAHRDPETLHGRPPCSSRRRVEPFPVSVPPWWRMKKKNAMFYTTFGRGDHARFMILGLDAVRGFRRGRRRRRAYAPTFGPSSRARAARSIRSRSMPLWPTKAGQSSRPIAASSRHLWRGAAYPNLVIPLDVVGTAPEYALAATDGSLDRFYDGWSAPPYGGSVDMRPQGHHRPPLDGVWATAPYLHNGSVPDLRPSRQPAPSAVLAAPCRSARLDPSSSAGEYERLEHGKSAVMEPEARARVYTRRFRATQTAVTSSETA